jgi:hypothetical protein
MIIEFKTLKISKYRKKKPFFNLRKEDISANVAKGSMKNMTSCLNITE